MIEKIGWQVTIIDIEYVDLLAFSRGAFLRIQVKSAHRHKTSPHLYRYHIGKNDCKHRSQQIDVYAFVALDRRMVYFRPAELVDFQTYYVNSSLLEEPNIEQSSWQQSLAVIFKE